MCERPKQACWLPSCWWGRGPQPQSPGTRLARWTPAYFTYTVELVAEGKRGQEMVLRGQMESLIATDSRATGSLVTVDATLDGDASDELGPMLGTAMYRLINDGGAWTGTGRFVGVGADPWA